MTKKALGLFLLCGSVAMAETVTIEKMIVEEEGGVEKEKIQVTKMLDIAQVLSGDSADITMQRTSGIAADPVMRGFRNDNINVLIDGQHIYGGCPNRMDPPAAHVSTNQIETIKVTKGPFDVTTQGGLGGEINVVTKNPSKGLSGEISAKGGSFGYQNFGANVNGGNDLIQAMAGFQTYKMDVYEDGDGDKISDIQSAYDKDDTLFETQNSWAKLQLTPDEKSAVRVGYALDKIDHQLYAGKKMDGVKDDTIRVNAEWEQRDLGSFSDKLLVKAYQNKVEHDMDNYTYRTAMMEMVNETTASTSGASIANTVGTFEFGLDTQSRTWTADIYSSAGTQSVWMLDATMNNMGLYAQDRTRLGKLQLSYGIRYDSTKIVNDLPAAKTTNPLYTGEDEERSDSLVSGYLSMDHKLSDSNRYYVSLGSGNRIADPKELYVYKPSSTGDHWFGNPDLKPTTNTELDAGYAYTGTGVKFEINGFYSSLKNYIYEEQVSGTTTKSYANIDATIYGADIMAAYTLSDMLVFSFNSAVQQGKKESRTDGMTNDNLAGLPPMKTIVKAEAFFGDGDASFEAVNYATQTHMDEDIEPKQVDGITVLNVKGSYTVAKSFMLTAGVDNIMDETYALSTSYDRDPVNESQNLVNEPGRFVYAGVSYRF